MKNEISTKKKYVLIRKILILSILILLPIIAITTYVTAGFINNKITPKLCEQFEVSSVNIIDGEKFDDFKFTFEIATYTIPEDNSTKSSASASWKATIENGESTQVSNVTLKVCLADYWAAYVTTASTKEGLSASSTATSGTITVDYEHKNGFGAMQTVSKKPDVYVYMSYDLVDSTKTVKKNNECVLKYSFEKVTKTVVRK